MGGLFGRLPTHHCVTSQPRERGLRGLVPHCAYLRCVLTRCRAGQLPLLALTFALSELICLRLAGCRGMRRLIAIALLLLSSLPGRAQDERPASFVDAATVVPGLVVDMRYFSDNNF